MAQSRPPHIGRHLNPVEPPAAGQASDRPDPADLYAALDLGTNSCRMLIGAAQGQPVPCGR